MNDFLTKNPVRSFLRPKGSSKVLSVRNVEAKNIIGSTQKACSNVGPVLSGQA
jgi:hypothetical protein